MADQTRPEIMEVQLQNKAKKFQSDKIKKYKRILDKFNSWKFDIYENNRSDWTKEDEKDLFEIQEILESKI
jgi:hypothetical protein